MATVIFRHLIGPVVLFSVTLQAQKGSDPSGHWEGAIHTPQMAIAIEVDLARNNTGELAGTINVPPQNLKGFPLVIESVEGRAIAFRFRGARGTRLFQGVFSEDGTSITGDFVQSGFVMRFELGRTGEARIEGDVPPAVEIRGRLN